VTTREPAGDPVGDPQDDLTGGALVAELARRTGVCWIRVADRTHPVWHAWSNGGLCVVGGGLEQPLPDLVDGDRVEILMRSKDTGGRLVTWVGRVSVVRAGDELWEPATAALVARRNNLRDPVTAADDWARHSLVLRIQPPD
jgi:hypothetical protein